MSGTEQDNLKACVTWACWRKPMVSYTYPDLVRHYGTAKRWHGRIGQGMEDCARDF
jgi:hypothetical protein